MQNKYICCSSPNKEWLVLADNDTCECLLLNMSTMEKVDLPSTCVEFYRRCVLSLPNVAAGCRVLFFNRNRLKFKSCYIGDSEFIKRDLHIDFEEGLSFMAAINYNGKLYVMTMDHHLMVAEFSDPFLHLSIVIRGDEITALLPFYFQKTRHYLVESCGELLFIYKTGSDHELSDLKIYRADLSCGKWESLQSLGDRAIFLDAANCYACPASGFGLRGNFVYYVNKYGRNLYRYDVQEQSTTISLPSPIVSSRSALSWLFLPS